MGIKIIAVVGHLAIAEQDNIDWIWGYSGFSKPALKWDSHSFLAPPSSFMWGSCISLHSPSGEWKREEEDLSWADKDMGASDRRIFYWFMREATQERSKRWDFGFVVVVVLFLLLRPTLLDNADLNKPASYHQSY